MKKVAIMQPYFFPYIGYWQLLNLVDEFVIYDDVNYQRGGWGNRNRILLKTKNEQWSYININLQQASQNRKYNEIKVQSDDVYKRRTLDKITAAYHKAPYYATVFDIIEDIISGDYESFVDLIRHSIFSISSYLGISTRLCLSSMIKRDISTLCNAEEKLLQICKKMRAKEYYSLMGSAHLYSTENFKRQGIDFYFLRANEIVYKQFDNEFVSNLSIIDVMMFNSALDVKSMLTEFSVAQDVNELRDVISR